MKIEDILEGIEVVIKHDGTLEFDAKELTILLNYIANLQRKEYNNSKAIEFINNLEKDYDENVWVENEYYVHILDILEKGE